MFLIEIALKLKDYFQIFPIIIIIIFLKIHPLLFWYLRKFIWIS